jgi:hypothetical protein
MIIFLLIFIFLYGGLNFYAFSRVKNIFHFSGKVQIIVTILLVLLILAPMIIRLAESRHLETLARSMAYIGYLWMAFVFLFFFLDIIFNVVRHICKFFYKNAGSAPIKKIVFGLCVFFLSLCCLWIF